MVWDKHRKSYFSDDYFPSSVNVLSGSLMNALWEPLLGRWRLSLGFILDPLKFPVSPLVPDCSPVCELALFTGELERNFRWLMNDSQILKIMV